MYKYDDYLNAFGEEAMKQFANYCHITERLLAEILNKNVVIDNGVGLNLTTLSSILITLNFIVLAIYVLGRKSKNIKPYRYALFFVSLLVIGVSGLSAYTIYKTESRFSQTKTALKERTKIERAKGDFIIMLTLYDETIDFKKLSKCSLSDDYNQNSIRCYLDQKIKAKELNPELDLSADLIDKINKANKRIVRQQKDDLIWKNYYGIDK